MPFVVFEHQQVDLVLSLSKRSIMFIVLGYIAWNDHTSIIDSHYTNRNGRILLLEFGPVDMRFHANSIHLNVERNDEDSLGDCCASPHTTLPTYNTQSNYRPYCGCSELRNIPLCVLEWGYISERTKDCTLNYTLYIYIYTVYNYNILQYITTVYITVYNYSIYYSI